MLDRFVRLCEIASPTGSERAVADTLLAELRGLGVQVQEDRAAEPAQAGSGNLIARMPGERDGWVMFASHLDTVPHRRLDRGGPGPGRLSHSAGETILGADNKAAVTVLLELAARHAERPAALGLELVFTVAEEDGLRGAKELDLESLRSPFGFVLDHASPVGEIVTAAPTYKRLAAEFEGIEAHSGIRPEDGRSAIQAAAAAISAMKLGRLDDETTANVGVIARRDRLQRRARPLPRRRRGAEPRRRASQRHRRRHGGRVHLGGQRARLRRRRPGDRDVPRLPAGRPASRAVIVARAALERCGVEPHEVATGGGSDANAFSAAGFECVLLANGTEANHTPEESVAADRIVQMLARLRGDRSRRRPLDAEASAAAWWWRSTR